MDEIEASVDETTALLADSSKKTSEPETTEVDENALSSNSTAVHDEDKPLPLDQIILLCLAQVIEPIAFFCIFPFINQMIWDTGEVAKTDVGFYSGLIVRAHNLHVLP